MPLDFADRACRAAARFLFHQVATWTVAKTVFFMGTLGFADDDVDRYRRNLRFAQGNGKYLLRCHNVDKFIDLGFQLKHAHVLVGINKAWKREFTILHRPKGITDPQVYVPNFAALEKADKEAEEVRVVIADRTVE